MFYDKDIMTILLQNAWWLCLPLLGGGLYVCAGHKNLFKRMTDMTGYDKKEKFFTVFASILPYPFMIITILTPFTNIRPVLYMGATIYAIGVALYLTTLNVIIKTPVDMLFTDGPYKISRNPMYVSAAVIIIGICIMTANIVLIGIFIIMLLFQHLMILAEERECRLKYGVTYDNYTKKVPRYIFF